MAAPTCFVSLDEFGSQVLGVHQDWLEDAGRDDLLATAAWVWGGQRERPRRARFWLRDAPRWTVSSPDEEPCGGECDAGAVLSLLKDFLPDRLAGGSTGDVKIVLVGSLAVPGTGEVVRGWVGALDSARGEGALTLRLRESIVLGMGALTYPDSDPREARRRAGSALLELQDQFVSTPSSLIPCYLVGEEPPARGPQLDARSQAQVAGLATVGIQLQSGIDVDEEEWRPFAFSRSRKDLVHLGQRADPVAAERPFVALGGAMIRFPLQPLRQSLAAGFVAATCRAHATQDPDAGEAPRGDVGGQVYAEDELSGLVDLVAEGALAAIREKGSPDLGSARPWSWQGASSLVRHTMRAGTEVVEGLYGPQRFLKLPLEDWEAALADLEAFLDSAVMTRRRRDLAVIAGASVEGFEAGLSAAFERIGESVAAQPVLLRPRKAGRQLVSALLAEARAAKQAGEAQWLGTSHPDKAEMDSLAKDVGSAHDALKADLRAVPSPHAVVLRTGLWTIGCLAVALGLPVSFGIADSPWVRILLGVVAAALVAVPSYLSAHRAKRDLETCLQKWEEAYHRHQDALDERLAFDSAQAILSAVVQYCEWLLGETDEPGRAFASSIWPTAIDRAAIQRGLESSHAGYRRRMMSRLAFDAQEAARSWDAARDEILRGAVQSRVVFALPILEGDPEPVLGALFGDLPGVAEDPNVDSVAQDLQSLGLMMDEALSDERRESEWIPFRPSERPQRWMVGLGCPSGEALLTEGAERGNGMAFFAVMERYLKRYLTADLKAALSNHLGVPPGQLHGVPMSDRDVFDHLNRASGVTIAHGGMGHAREVGLPWGEADLLLAGLEPDASLILGPNTSALIRLREGLSAQDVLFGGDPDHPPSHLGRAMQNSDDRRVEPASEGT